MAAAQTAAAQLAPLLSAASLAQRLGQGVAQTLADALPSDWEALAGTALARGAACAACLASLLLVLATGAAGWAALWHTTMKDIGFFREIMGLNRPRPDVKAQRQASIAAEIEKIKRQHSRSSAVRQRQNASMAPS